MRYRSSHKVLLMDFFGGSKKIKSYTLSLRFSYEGNLDLDKFEEGLNTLLEGNLILESTHPLAPVFQVLEAMSLFSIILVESMSLKCLGKTFFNLISRNSGILVEWLEISLDNKISYLYVKEGLDAKTINI